jgi:hypothetical protein
MGDAVRRTHQDDPDGPTPNAPRAGEPAAGRKILRIGARGRRFLGAVALAALVLGAAYIVSKPGSGTPTANGTAAASSFGEIESFVQDEMAAQRIPGLALGIVEGDRITYVRGFGRADDSGNEVTPQTPFIIGSVSKSFTALAVMQLVEAKEGRTRCTRAALCALVPRCRRKSLSGDHRTSPAQPHERSFDEDRPIVPG